MRRKGNNTNKGLIAIVFAVGLLISCFCPPKFLVGILAIWVIILAVCMRVYGFAFFAV